MRTNTILLRNIPGDIVMIAEAIAQQTGLSLIDVCRVALGSGVLIEATKITPDHEGTYAGLDGAYLAKALRRHLSSAIDLLLASGEHPIANGLATQTTASEKVNLPLPIPTGEQESMFDPALGDDLESLGIGLGLSQP